MGMPTDLARWWVLVSVMVRLHPGFRAGTPARARWSPTALMLEGMRRPRPLVAPFGAAEGGTPAGSRPALVHRGGCPGTRSFRRRMRG